MEYIPISEAIEMLYAAGKVPKGTPIQFTETITDRRWGTMVPWDNRLTEVFDTATCEVK